MILDNPSLVTYAKIKYHPWCKPKYSKKYNKDVQTRYRQKHPESYLFDHMKRYFENPIKLLNHGQWV